MILKVKKILKTMPLYDFSVVVSGHTIENDTIRRIMRQSFGNQGFLYENDEENETQTEVADTFCHLWNTYCYTESENFDRIYESLTADYNPISNYDKRETETIETDHANDQYIQQKGTTTTTTLGTYKTNTKIATYSTAEKDTQEETRGHDTDKHDTVQTSGADTDTTIYGKETITRRNSTDGNIGVTTSQQMITSEIELRQYNFTLEIIKKFIATYCFTVWGDCE